MGFPELIPLESLWSPLEGELPNGSGLISCPMPFLSSFAQRLKATALSRHTGVQVTFRVLSIARHLFYRLEAKSIMSFWAVRPAGRDMDVVSAWCSGPKESAAR